MIAPRTLPANSFRSFYQISARSQILSLGQHTKIMGIVNVTPDSFSQDGCWNLKKRSPDSAIRYAQTLIRDGADVIDVGGESSRPGAKPITVEEELKRVIPVIKKLSQKNTHIPISIDTYKPQVAQAALDAGAVIVNNIFGTQLNTALLKMIARYDAAIVLMHMQGTPRNMQQRIHYRDLMTDIIDALHKSMEKCLEIGIKSDRIIIDPGIGFGKTVEHNLEIINCLHKLKQLHRPILVGTSRKSFIGKILDKDTSHRLGGTAASVSASILRGAPIVRVHDVKAMKDVVLLTDAILRQKA